MNRSKRCLLTCALALVAWPAAAGPLAIDTNTYQGTWHGSTSFQGFQDSGGGPTPANFFGHVDWAVYAPGNFPGAFVGTSPGGSAYTPPADEFVYAYQVYVTTDPLNVFPPNASPFSSLTVQLTNAGGGIFSFTGDGGFGNVAGDAPISMLMFTLDSATWDFNGILAGSSSRGLAFSSPNVPMFLSATGLDHGAVATILPVPSPSSQTVDVPEPSAMVLLLLGAIALGWRASRAARGRT